MPLQILDFEKTCLNYEYSCETAPSTVDEEPVQMN